MKARRVDLVCDGGPAIGYGHVRRTLTLAETLRDAGVEVRVHGMSERVRSLLPTRADGAEPAPVVVFDAPGGVDERIRGARAAGQCVVALDWFGEAEPDVAIVVYPHRTVRARRASYVGLQYQMIRAEIAAQPRGVEGKGVVVMLGGGDVLGQGHAAAKQLAAQGLQVTLVQGHLAADREGSAEYEVVVDPPDLPGRLAASAWMVTNGGGCMFEAMYLGKAAVALPQTGLEGVLAQFGHEQGAILGVGIDHLRPHAREVLRPIARRAAELVDSRGAQRVAEIVGALP